MDSWGVVVALSEDLGNHEHVVERLLSNETDYCNQQLLLLSFFRANIDEVETEVVEIEAKLDKVRLTLLPLTPCATAAFVNELINSHQDAFSI